MSSVSEVNKTRNQVQFNYDFTKIFIRNNNYRTINIAASGADIVLLGGELIGTIAATGKGKVLASGASDGSQFPTGIAAEVITIVDGANADVNICISGEVAKEKVIFAGADGYNTAVSSRILLDRIASDTKGIKVVATDQLAGTDNE